MPNFLFLGWLVGVISAGAVAVTILAALALSFPTGFSAWILAVAAWIFVVVLLAVLYMLGYGIATASLVGSLPAVTLPLAASVPTPGGVPVSMPLIAGESFARGFLIGLTAALNAAALALVPRFGPFLAAWAFTIVSLAAVVFVARNSIYQGFLGWSAWLLPMSYIATAVGLVLFVVNAPFAFAAGGIAAFRPDFTTGVIETTGGLTGLAGSGAGFSLGNFTFIRPGFAGGSFTAPSLASHETGHTLNTAAMGGVFLWINAVDQNVPPLRRMNIAYGELLAEGHAQVQPGTPLRAAFFVRLWA